jgi:hypothetical protein
MRTGALLVLALLAAGCAAAPGAPMGEAPRYRVPLDPAPLAGAAWLPGGWLVVSREVEEDGPERLFRLRPDGSGLQELPIPEDPACILIRHYSPISMGDGRVAFLRWCSVEVGPPELLLLMAFDPGSGETSELMSRPLEGFGSGVITWNTVKDRGMIGGVIAPCMTIAWLTPQGMEPAAITVSDGDRSWRLDEYLRRGGGGDCDGLGNAGWPTWSPDGETIAFFASPQAMGASDVFLSRLDAAWNLYVMDPDDQLPTRILEDLVDARGLEWSPDGKWLTFVRKIGGRDGGWLFAPTSGRLVQMSAEQVFPLAWSPDGQRILAALPPSGPELRNDELVILDVGTLISDR